MIQVTLHRLGYEKETFNSTTMEDAEARFQSLTFAYRPPTRPLHGAIVAVGISEGGIIRKLWYTPHSETLYAYLFSTL